MPSSAGNAYDRPLEVEAHDGEVVITGPGATAVALTAGAAAVSAERLAAAAKQAIAMLHGSAASQVSPSDR
jgi:hypothetical protein